MGRVLQYNQKLDCADATRAILTIDSTVRRGCGWVVAFWLVASVAGRTLASSRGGGGGGLKVAHGEVVQMEGQLSIRCSACLPAASRPRSLSYSARMPHETPTAAVATTSTD